MPKNSSNKHNQLKINELPPPFLEEAENVLTSDEALPEPQFGYYIINMMWRLLNALPSDDEFRFYEKDVLEDVLRYGSIDMIAKLNKVSPQTIRAKIKNALAHYEDLVRKLESNKEQSDRIKDLEKQLAVALSTPIPIYLREPYKPLQTYDFLKITPGLLKKLNGKGIYTLNDLLTCDNLKFKSMFGQYSKPVSDLHESLSSMRLSVGMFNPCTLDGRDDEVERLEAKIEDLNEKLKYAEKIAIRVSGKGDKLEKLSQRHKQSEEKLKNVFEFKESAYQARIRGLEGELAADKKLKVDLISRNRLLEKKMARQERTISSLNEKLDFLKPKKKKDPTYKGRLKKIERKHLKEEEKLKNIFDFKMSTYQIRIQVLESDLAAANKEIAKLKSKIKEI